MSVRVALLLEGRDAGAGKVLQDAQAGLARVEDAAQDAATEAGKVGPALVPPGAAAPRLRETAGAATEVAGAHRVAAGSVANLGAQFNDIGVMMAAGQDPLQLAIQQGTQITQVIGPMGAAGAARALGSALLSVVSPVSLLTIGVIAGGAALFNWARDASAAGRETVEFADALGEIDTGVGNAERALASLRDLTRDYNDLIAARALTQQTTSNVVIHSLAREATAQRAIAEIETIRAGRALASLEEQVAETRAALDAIREEKLQAARELLDINLSQTTNRDGGEFVRGPQERAQLDLLQQRAAARREELQALLAVTDEESALAEELRLQEAQLTLQQEALASIEREMENIRSAARSTTDVIVDGTEAIVGGAQAWIAKKLAAIEAGEAAQGILADLDAQVELQRQILLTGSDSVEVTELRAAAEREAFAEMLESEGIAGDLADRLWEAFENAQALARANIADPIWEGANAASVLARNLANAISQLSALRSQALGSAAARARRAQLRLDTVGDPVARAGGEAVFDFREGLDDGGYGLISAGRADDLAASEDAVRAAAENAAGLEERANAADAAHRRLVNRLNGGGRRGGRGGSSATRQERDAVAELIVKLREEIDLLRETDPIKQELLRHREVLAEATAAERAEIERLITAREQEMQTATRQREQSDFWKGNITDLVRNVDSLSDAWDRVRDSIADALIEAALWGEGPFGGGGGGLLGGIFGAIFPAVARAEGGMIHGAGGGRDDRVPIWGSAGEYVVNARATAQNRTLLERINAGMPAFAQGGMIGGGASVDVAAGAGSNELGIHVHVYGANGDRQIQDMVEQGVRTGLERYDSRQLPMSIKRIEQDPRLVGA